MIDTVLIRKILYYTLDNSESDLDVTRITSFVTGITCPLGLIAAVMKDLERSLCRSSDLSLRKLKGKDIDPLTMERLIKLLRKRSDMCTPYTAVQPTRHKDKDSIT